MITKKEIKKLWNNFWFLLWKDDSLKGWIFSIIIIFIFIKFIFFPGLSLVTGTALPLAIVESCSMYHDGNLLSNYNDWWEESKNKYNNFEISKEEFEKFKMKNGLNKGDILFITGTKPKNIEIGDIIIFNSGSKTPIIHRVINTSSNEGKFYFSTIGDNLKTNPKQLPIEKNIPEDQVMGKAQFKIAPYAGWIKLIFFENKKSSSNKGFCD
jgi:signal peptidase I|tara:strand:- start:2962 stop:3594 length:633 start_codon:yes stop_codon:yes gene_type:complete